MVQTPLWRGVVRCQPLSGQLRTVAGRLRTVEQLAAAPGNYVVMGQCRYLH
jgi:hypothetical protein